MSSLLRLVKENQYVIGYNDKERQHINEWRLKKWSVYTLFEGDGQQDDCHVVANAACDNKPQTARNPLFNKNSFGQPRKPQFLRPHQAAFIVSLGYIPTKGSGFDVSHICHRIRCQTLAHLVMESRSDNLSRIACHKIMQERQQHSYTGCPHQPKCCWNW